MFFLACLTIFADYTYNIKGLITIVIASVNAVIMVALFRKSEIDRNLIYLIIGVVMTFVNLAIPIQMNGYVIKFVLGGRNERTPLAVAKTHHRYLCIGFLALSVLVIISYVMDLFLNYVPTATLLPIALNPICITGLVVIAGFFVSKLLLNKEDRESIIEIGSLRFLVSKAASV